MGQLTISMTIFNSNLLNYQRVHHPNCYNLVTNPRGKTMFDHGTHDNGPLSSMWPNRELQIRRTHSSPNECFLKWCYPQMIPDNILVLKPFVLGIPPCSKATTLTTCTLDKNLKQTMSQSMKNGRLIWTVRIKHCYQCTTLLIVPSGVNLAGASEWSQYPIEYVKHVQSTLW